MIKNIFKHKSKMNTENNEQEELVGQVATENHEAGIESSENLTPEQKLEEEAESGSILKHKLFCDIRHQPRCTCLRGGPGAVFTIKIWMMRGY